MSYGQSLLIYFCFTDKMPIGGQNSVDLPRLLINNVVNVFKKKKTFCTPLCDGVILRMHYQLSFWIFLSGFCLVSYSWFHKNVLTCVSHFNAEGQVRMDLANLCLSYPFTKDHYTGEKRYLLFYRWTHYTLLALAMCCYIPRKLSKRCENPRVKKLLEDLQAHSHRYDASEKELVERAARYLAYNLQTHDGVFWKFIGCNFLALLVDLFCFFFLDFIFQGNFRNYGILAVPFNRDWETFNDPMYNTFPPFVNCEVRPTHMLLNKRTETFGCQLTQMEIYEKLFVFIWYWIIFLGATTTLYIIFTFFMWLPWFSRYLLKGPKPATCYDPMSETITKVLNRCKVGDVYLLYRFKQHLSPLRYYELLSRLADEDTLSLMIQDPIDRSQINQEQQRHHPNQRKGGHNKFNGNW